MPLITGRLVMVLATEAALAACLRTKSAHDLGAGSGGGEDSVAGSVCLTSSVVWVDSVSEIALDFVEVTESRCAFRKATGLVGIAGIIGITGMTGRADFG